MKKILLLFIALFGFMHLFAANTENLYNYHIKEYPTFEEFKEHYINKVITYSPDINAHGNIFPQMGLGFTLREFSVISISLEKKKKDYFVMEWLIKEVNSYMHKSFTVYIGNYTKKPESNKDEYFFRDLPFYDFTISKSEIGKTFSDPLVKAKYEVTDVFFDIREIKYKKGLYKFYKLKNTITGQTSEFSSGDAANECFMEDKSGSYVSTLSKVEKPSNPSVKYGKTTTVKDMGVTKYSYEDNFINIIIFGNSEKFSFTLKNVSQSTQKLIWDEAVFVNTNGSTSKVMHSGIKYSQREAPQTPSTIIKGATLDDIACPTDNVYYSDNLKQWNIHSMYPQTISNKTYTVQLMLPIQIKDVVNEYIFIFDVKYRYNHPDRLNL